MTNKKKKTTPREDAEQTCARVCARTYNSRRNDARTIDRLLTLEGLQYWKQIQYQQALWRQLDWLPWQRSRDEFPKTANLWNRWPVALVDAPSHIFGWYPELAEIWVTVGLISQSLPYHQLFSRSRAVNIVVCFPVFGSKHKWLMCRLTKISGYLFRCLLFAPFVAMTLVSYDCVLAVSLLSCKTFVEDRLSS